MSNSIAKRNHLKFSKVISPVTSMEAWQVESFLLRTFEYGNYSFRSALCGTYGKDLRATFIVAKDKGDIVAAAGCLYSLQNPAIAIMGPVCVDPAYQRHGLGSELCENILEHLEGENTIAVYLGVKKQNAAKGLYAKAGFTDYVGIVMRKLLSDKKVFEQIYPQSSHPRIRKMAWSDYPAISALMCEPMNFYTLDFMRGIYSSRYIKPERFLPVFPEMMESSKTNGNFANVLLPENSETPFGIAQVSCLSSSSCNYTYMLDFFTHNNFVTEATELASKTISESAQAGVKNLFAHCLACDATKKGVLESLGAKKSAVVADYVHIGDICTDLIIYKL